MHQFSTTFNVIAQYISQKTMQYVLLITSKYKPTLIQNSNTKTNGRNRFGIRVSQRDIYHFTSSNFLSEMHLSFCRFKFFIFIILQVYMYFIKYSKNLIIFLGYPRLSFCRFQILKLWLEKLIILQGYHFAGFIFYYFDGSNLSFS